MKVEKWAAFQQEMLAQTLEVKAGMYSRLLGAQVQCIWAEAVSWLLRTSSPLLARSHPGLPGILRISPRGSSEVHMMKCRHDATIVQSQR